VREQGLLSLEEAVRRMSGLAAETFQLHRYGRIEDGARANLVIFDPARVIDRATFEDSKQYPAGIEYVIVGGELTVCGERQFEYGNGVAVRAQCE
jgi:N-acyl-D-aspartate/D-glutamate deacylase